MTTDDKRRENRLRRVATRQGFALRKSRRRDVHAVGYSGYQIIEPDTSTLIVGHYFELSLNDVEAWLNKPTFAKKP